MFNKQKFSHQQSNENKLNDLVEEQFKELSDEESEKIKGGFFYNPYLGLNSYYWPSTQAILDVTKRRQASFDRQNENFLKTLRDS